MHTSYVHLVEGQYHKVREVSRMDVEGACGRACQSFASMGTIRMQYGYSRKQKSRSGKEM